VNDFSNIVLFAFVLRLDAMSDSRMVTS